MSNATAVTADTFEQEVLKSEVPVLVEAPGPDDEREQNAVAAAWGGPFNAAHARRRPLDAEAIV